MHTSIYATEEEVLDGGQQWDMNPVIFYRLKRPIANIESLPPININANYSREESTEDS